MHGAGYTRFVRLARLLLPVVAVVICGVVIARMSKSPVQQIESVPAREKAAAGDSTLLKAQYEGVDDNGRPYTLIAQSARRGEGDNILLEALEADIVLADGAWVAVRAKAGVYDARGARLSLSPDVRIFHDGGYEMTMDKADIDLKGRLARADGAVRAQGPLGEIEASGLEVKAGGSLIVFGGPATLRLRGLKGAAG